MRWSSEENHLSQEIRSKKKEEEEEKITLKLKSTWKDWREIALPFSFSIDEDSWKADMESRTINPRTHNHVE